MSAAGARSSGRGLAMSWRRHREPTELISFCDPCAVEYEEMSQVHRAIEKNLKKKIARFDTRLARNRELLSILDDVGCNSAPFYYNRRNHQAVCGPTTYQNLRRWAEGDDCSFIEVPEELQETDESLETAKRVTGLKARVTKRIVAWNSG